MSNDMTTVHGTNIVPRNNGVILRLLVPLIGIIFVGTGFVYALQTSSWGESESVTATVWHYNLPDGYYGATCPPGSVLQSFGMAWGWSPWAVTCRRINLQSPDSWGTSESITASVYHYGLPDGYYGATCPPGSVLQSFYFGYDWRNRTVICQHINLRSPNSSWGASESVIASGHYGGPEFYNYSAKCPVGSVLRSFYVAYAWGDHTVTCQRINFGTPSIPVPTVSLTANPTSVPSGGGSSSTLTWSSTNATSCTASGGWSGVKATSGSQIINNITTNTTYTLTCTGSGGSAIASATVVVNPPPVSCVVVTCPNYYTRNASGVCIFNGCPTGGCR